MPRRGLHDIVHSHIMLTPVANFNIDPMTGIRKQWQVYIGLSQLMFEPLTRSHRADGRVVSPIQYERNTICISVKRGNLRHTDTRFGRHCFSIRK